MKLVLAIINHDDANTVTQSLTKKGFSSTKLATTGGFLKRSWSFHPPTHSARFYPKKEKQAAPQCHRCLLAQS